MGGARGGRQLNIGNPLGGLPVYANEKNVCHLYPARLNKGCNSFFDFSLFYSSKRQLVTNLMLIKVKKS